MQHLTDQKLERFIAAGLDAAEEKSVEAHLAQCPECAQRVLELERKPQTPFMRDMKAASADSEPSKAYQQSTEQYNPPARGFSAGTVLGGNFRLEKQLGKGGMGEAWKAYDLNAERAVVLKFVPKEIQHVEKAMADVRDSFKKVHSLQHQHICPVYGLFTDPEHGLYVVMKYIDGVTLGDYKRNQIQKHGKMSFADALQILWAMAKGLDYAHEKKVVHRDIKPANVMIDKNDGVQIIDFGLAEEIRTSLVQYSEVVMDISGTRPYMAPEQWKGKLQDSRTDQYALAVTAYEMIAGHFPFHSTDTAVLRECVLRDTPDPIKGIPEHINNALLKALSKKREDRFPDCKSFIKAMAETPKTEVKADVKVEVRVLQAAPPAGALDFLNLPSDHDSQSSSPPAAPWLPSSTSKKAEPAVSAPPKTPGFKPRGQKRAMPEIPAVNRKNAWIYGAAAGVAAILLLGAFFMFPGKPTSTETDVASSSKTSKPSAEKFPTADDQEEIDRFLAEYGKNVMATDNEGKTLLHKAAEQNRIAVVKYLVSAGADVNPKNNDGKTPHDFAKEKGNTEIVEYLTNAAGAPAVQFSEDGKTLIKYPADNPATTYTIPAGVETIGENAFSGSKHLVTVNIPNSVKEIGVWAFGFCEALKSVVIPDSVKKIGNHAFSHSGALESIIIPDSVTSIGHNAFWVCGLKSVTISANITKLENGTFHWCRDLRYVVIPDGVTEIGDGVFGACTGLESIVIPDSVTSIGGGAFQWGWSLKSLTLPPNITRLEGGLFNAAGGITSIQIPEKVESINEFAIHGCNGITSLVIPSSVKWIGENGISNNENLAEITFLGNPDIHDGAFNGCNFDILTFRAKRGTKAEAWAKEKGIKFIELTEDEAASAAQRKIKIVESEVAGVQFSEDGKILIKYPIDNPATSYTIPDGVMIIGTAAFRDAKHLVKVRIPDGVKKIGWDAFLSCEALESMIIPDSVILLEKGAFGRCENLKSVKLSKNITGLDIHVFIGCRSLMSIDIPESVKFIENEGFAGCRMLNEVTFLGDPDIHNDAFDNCNFANMTFYANKGTKAEAFAAARGIPFVDFSEDKTAGVQLSEDGKTLIRYSPSKTAATYAIPADVEIIAKEAFLGSKHLVNVRFPKSIKEIGDYAFSDCEALESVTIPDSVTSIGGMAFMGCKNLKSVTLPANITRLGTNAFGGCHRLTSIQFPEKMENIPGICFASCGFTSIIIPKNVKSIDNGGFGVNQNLTEVIFLGDPNLHAAAFADCNFAAMTFKAKKGTKAEAFAKKNSIKFTALAAPGSDGILFSEDKKTLVRYPSDRTETSYIVPVRVERIESWGDNPHLTTIRIPAGVATLKLFEGDCPSLKEIVVDAANKNFKAVDGILFSKDGKTLLRYPPAKKAAAYTVPANVQTIAASAFSRCVSLTDLTFLGDPDIDSAAFSGCNFPALTIHAHAGTTAEAVAKRHGMRFTEMED